MDTDAGT